MKKTIITFGLILLIIVVAGMFKFNYLSAQSGYDVDGNRIEKDLTQASDKIFGIDQGTVSASETLGFKKYNNKQLNVSFLTPDSWKGQVGMGGSYTIFPMEKDANSIVDISARTITFNFLTDGNSPANPSIEDYKKMREAFITEENIGKNLQVSMKKETFDGQEGYKIDYTYTLTADGSQNFNTEYFTVRGDTIYSLAFAGSLDEKENHQDTFDTVKESYKILDISKK